MAETIMTTEALRGMLFDLITTKKVRVHKTGDMVQLFPVKEKTDCTKELRGMFAGCPELTVDRYLEEKRAEKESEL